MSDENPTVRSRQLGAELRALREKRGVTCEQAGRAVGLSTATISRLENGKRVPKPDSLAALLGFYQVSSKKRDELLDLCRTAAERGWWQRLSPDIPASTKSLISFENQATQIMQVESNLVPGLLQTADYMRTVMRARRRLNEDQIEERVITRVSRQAILSREHPPHVCFVVDEAVLRRPIGGRQIMSEQLRKLVRAAQRPTVDLRVIAPKAGTHPAVLDQFELLEFHEAPPVVYVELATSILLMDDKPDVKTYYSIWSALAKVAMSKEESTAFVAEVATEYEQSGDATHG